MSSFELATARGTLRWQGTAVMGILNVTPDSFSDGGSHRDEAEAVAHALRMMNQGALLIDVGGESTRPGSTGVTAAEEIRRTGPVVRRLSELGVPVSIDTMKPEVAADALEGGAWIVNDVSGLRDPDMIRVTAGAGAGVIVMHMLGEPRTMQEAPGYADVFAEVRAELLEAAARARAAGVASVMIDPGIGFGKTLDHNLELLRRLPELTADGLPVLVGASRKGMLGKITGAGAAADRDAASVAVHLYAAGRGAAMVRVHDVAGHVQALKVWQALAGGEE